MELRCKFRELDGGDTPPGWWWDADIRTWVWGETQPWWMAWLEVRQGIDRGAPYSFRPGCRWDVTWVEVTHEYRDLDGVETLSGGRCDVTIWTWIGLRQYMYGGETKIVGPGSRWDRTWMELRHCLEGGVMWLYGPGLGWDSTCMEVRLKSLDPDPDEIGPGWRWDTYLESLMALWGCLYGAEVQFWGLGWRWDVTWMEMRHKHKDLDWSEKPHGWKVGMNQCNWGEVRRKSRDLAEDEMGPGLSWDTHL